ncbi:hypothetical protein [Rhizobium hidalgonense]|uniref:hypothetical protein n=1 Tax=Rhizobium hidalgonense TaxID=1538159 RepID=UPI00110644B4|nr:hypothetical protein [Rhizobium hidalgonense]MDR9809820.1 hypothetical protein [Rhizobium hidalgonense]MDR9818150.1 hypothetical protein [Rhizobium hidalgonense]QKK27189.1 hypothetical protein FFM81_028565 [Rhizobium hidalgonense]
MNNFSPSQAFADFFFLAIDHGFASVEDGGGPLTPFTMLVDPAGQKKLTRFAMAKLEDGVQAAKNSVAPAEAIAMYAIAWDGFVTLEGRKWDAICVEAGEAHAEFGALFCQRYTTAKKGLLRRTRSVRVGNPALIERPPSRLWVGGGL